MSDNQPLDISRGQWASRFGFIMATAGAAVGLGNIWRFPFAAGENGGGVFVLAYLFFVFVIGLPAMIAELIIGRAGQQNTSDSLRNLAFDSNQSPAWGNLGILCSVTLIMVLSFYSVVAGWSMAYFFMAVKGIFGSVSPEYIQSIWDNLLSHPHSMIYWHSIFMICTMMIIALGVNKGIERASNWMMPALFIILIALVIISATVGDFRQAVQFLFAFKLQDLTLRAVIDAMGQAFFSLATGAGAILVYGSYLSKKTRVVSTVCVIAGLDVLVAILSGLAIFPIVFAYDLPIQGGPGLMFQTLPLALANLPGTNVLAACFFLLLIFAALSSSISMAEPLVAQLHEKSFIPRKRASILVGLAAWLLGLCSVFSFNIWQNVKIFNRFGVFEIMTGLPTNIFLPIGGVLFCIFAGWIIKEKIRSHQFDADAAPITYLMWRASVRYITPAGILVILLAGLLMP